MSAPKIRGDYSALTTIAKTFGQAAANLRQMMQRLQSQQNTLQAGDWIGVGADKFYAEMNGSVTPALKRLVAAMSSAQSVTQQIHQIVKQAEDEASRCFRLDGSGGAPGGGSTGTGSGGGAVMQEGATQGEGLSQAASGGLGAAIGAAVGGILGGGLGAAIGGAVGGAIGSALNVPGTPGAVPGSADKSWQQNPLFASDPNQIFTESYMRSVVGLQVQGADNPALNTAMQSLFNDPRGPGAQQALATIAEVRGLPMEQVQADYQKYLQIRDQAAANNPEAIPGPGGGIFHSSYNSLSQLRFGKVMGDAFGIDPVFGSMLSPTGGLVGPGGQSFDGDSTAVGYHGIIHDAGGYLKNYHNAGPGYDYLGLEGRDTRDPLSGQRAGISYWRGIVGNDAPSVAADVLAEGITLYDKGRSAWNSIKGFAGRIF